MTIAYALLCLFALCVGIRTESRTAVCLGCMMAATLAVETVTVGIPWHFLAMGAVTFAAALMVTDWTVRAVLFLDAALNFSMQALWIAATHDADANRLAHVAYETYPTAVWTINAVLVVCLIRILRRSPPDRGGEAYP